MQHIRKLRSLCLNVLIASSCPVFQSSALRFQVHTCKWVGIPHSRFSHLSPTWRQLWACVRVGFVLVLELPEAFVLAALLIRSSWW